MPNLLLLRRVWFRRAAPALLVALILPVLASPQDAPLQAAAFPAGQRIDGFNVIVVSGHAFGTASAARALAAAKRLGATAIAIVPFLWQAKTSSPDILRGTDMSDNELRQAIRQAKAQGLTSIVKPHVWVPESWAGAVEPDSEAAWQSWFSDYRREIARIGRLASEEGDDALAIGTELK